MARTVTVTYCYSNLYYPLLRKRYVWCMTCVMCVVGSRNRASSFVFFLLFLFLLFLKVAHSLVVLPHRSLARGGAKPHGAAPAASFQRAAIAALGDTARGTLVFCFDRIAGEHVPHRTLLQLLFFDVPSLFLHALSTRFVVHRGALVPVIQHAAQILLQVCVVQLKRSLPLPVFFVRKDARQTPTVRPLRHVVIHVVVGATVHHFERGVIAQRQPQTLPHVAPHFVIRPCFGPALRRNVRPEFVARDRSPQLREHLFLRHFGHQTRRRFVGFPGDHRVVPERRLWVGVVVKPWAALVRSVVLVGRRHDQPVDGVGKLHEPSRRVSGLLPHVAQAWEARLERERAEGNREEIREKREERQEH